MLDIQGQKRLADVKFTEFASAVKQALSNKLSNHKDTRKYVSDFDKIQNMKQVFNKISNSND